VKASDLLGQWNNDIPTSRRIKYILLAGLVIYAVIAAWRWFAFAPNLRDGDLIFQTSRSSQSTAIGIASLSLYTHMGIIRYTPHGVVVIEAAGPVRETPLKAWIGRYAVYRAPGLKPAQTEQVFWAAKRLYGRPYDPYFSFEDSAIYCSELVDLAFSSAGIRLGKRQRIADLVTLTGPAEGLLKRRALTDPQYRTKKLGRQACLSLIMDRQLITPVSIANDRKLKQVYSTYPF